MPLYLHHMGQARSHLAGTGLCLQGLPLSSHLQHGCHPPEFPRQDVTNSLQDSPPVFRTLGSPPLRHPTAPLQHPQFNSQTCLIPTRSRQTHITSEPHPINTGPRPDSTGNLPWCLGRLGSLSGSWRNSQMSLCSNERPQY